MKKKIVPLILLALFISAALPLAALDVPLLKGHVNDYANMLKPATVATLEKELSDFEKKESTQIVVLAIQSLKGEPLEEYSMKVAEKWKIGQKKLDNGAILLVAKEDRKMRIEVGYGLEGKLTDLLAGRIIDSDIKPSFKKGDYDAGILQGARSMMQAVTGEYAASPAQTAVDSGKSGALSGPFIVFLVLGGFALLLIIIIFLAKKFPSSGGGGGSSGSSDGWSSSSSDSSGSSSSDSGSSGSDSYSGGGGKFGGGGASGDW